MKIHFKYRKTWWWYFVHYNYFHRRLFKEFYVRHRKFSEKQKNKYHLFQCIDDLITLRNWEWLRVFIWKLDWKINGIELEDQPKKIFQTSDEYYGNR